MVLDVTLHRADEYRSEPVTFSYSLSNDGKQFGPEQTPFALPQGAEDSFGVTPAFVTRAGHVLGLSSLGTSSFPLVPSGSLPLPVAVP
jgi:hypothetical protein